MTTLLHLLLWVVLTGAVGLLLTVVAVRWAWRRVRRAASSRARRLVASAPRSVGVGSARLVAPGRVRVMAALPGAGREVAVVRRDLRADVSGAVRAVAAGRQAGRPVEALGSIARRLDGQARVLDVDLAVIATEPDVRTRRQLLATQDDRVTLLRRACAEVRRGVLLAGTTTTAPLLASMVGELNDEVILLGLRARAYAELTHGAEVSPPT